MATVTYAKFEGRQVLQRHIHIANEWEPMPSYPNWVRGLCKSCGRWVEVTKETLNGQRYT